MCEVAVLSWLLFIRTPGRPNDHPTYIKKHDSHEDCREAEAKFEAINPKWDAFCTPGQR
jgi:hypothetical protein